MISRTAPARRPGRRAYLMISGFALLLVLFPFLFWYQTWFGRKLSDQQLDSYFADRAKPRRAQHALVQLSERIQRRQDISRWYPQVVEASSSPSLEIRQTAAWIMGQDRTYTPFHEALRRMLGDGEPMVRRNAALGLAPFEDPAARPELIAMLRPYTVSSPAGGVVKLRLKAGDYVNPGTLVARVGAVEVRSPVPGEVRTLESKDGAVVKRGDPLLDLGVDRNHVWDALRALYLVGQTPDLEDVQHFTRPVPGMPDVVARQAALTAQAIEARNRQP